MIVWLASWPRSGNTFVRILLKSCFGIATYSLYNDAYFAEQEGPLQDWVGHASYDGDLGSFLEQAKTDPGLHVIKTHDTPLDSLPAIYVVRHGLAASVSYSHYVRPAEGNHLSLSDIVRGRGWSGGWGDHIRAWNPLNRANTLLVRYEDLIADPRGEVRRMGEFLDRPPIGGEIPEFDSLKAADPLFFRSGSASFDRADVPNEVVDAFWQLDGDVAASLGYARESGTTPGPATFQPTAVAKEQDLDQGAAVLPRRKYLVYRCGMVGLGHTLTSILNCMWLAHDTGRILALDLRQFPFFAESRHEKFFEIFELRGPPDLIIETAPDVIDTLLAEPDRIEGGAWQDIDIDATTVDQVAIIDSTLIRDRYTMANKTRVPQFSIGLRGRMAERVAEQLAKLPKGPRIGLHFRHGNGEYLHFRFDPLTVPDYAVRYSEMKVRYAELAALTASLRGYLNPTYVVASDSADFIASMKQRLPNSYNSGDTSLDIPWTDLQQRSDETEFLYRALLDLWYLSSCDFMIHSQSLFPEFASLNSITLTAGDVHCVALRGLPEILDEAPANAAVAMARKALHSILQDRALEMEIPAVYYHVQCALVRAGCDAAAEIAEQRRQWAIAAIMDQDFNNSRSLELTGSAAAALEHAQRSLANLPDNPQIALAVARLLKFLGRLEEAEAQLRRVLQLDSGFPGAHIALSRTLDHLGRFDEAMETARHAAAQDPDDPAAAAQLQELQDRIVAGGVLMNVAVGKRATQSSRAPGSRDNDPQYAVNGTRTGGYAFSTDIEEAPWWELDLGTIYSVRRIVIYNRDDDYAERARTLVVSAAGTAWGPWFILHMQDGVFGGVRAGNPLVLDFAEPIVTRHLRLTLRDENYLHLDQVEVYCLSDTSATVTADPTAQQRAEAISAQSAPPDDASSNDTPADTLEQIGKSLVTSGRADAAQHAFEAAAELDLLDPVLQFSYGGPLNGQQGRQQLFCDMLRLIAPAAIVETGAFRGTSTEWMASVFQGRILTCEIEPRYFIQARRKLARFPYVSVFNQDSRVFLTSILPTLPRDRAVLFYLDAHGSDDLPLDEEVRKILAYSLHSVIMVDDFRVPWDTGYGFDEYGPDRTLDLRLLSFLADGPARIFFPSLPSAEETGQKRGSCVIAAAPEVLAILDHLPDLQGTDWTGAPYSAVPDYDAPINIARDCLAGQSSYSRWSRSSDAQGAVNGLITGRFGFHTKFERNPWWMVDLGSVRLFDEIVVYNRMDRHRERSRTLQILISSDGENWERVHAQNNVIFGGIDGKPLRVHRPHMRARYVRLQLDGVEYLHLDEVQIFDHLIERPSD